MIGFVARGKLAGALMLALFCASLPMRAVRYCAVDPTTVPAQNWDYGLAILLSGWLGILLEGVFGWLANPFLLLIPVALFNGERAWRWFLWMPLLFLIVTMLQSPFERDYDAGRFVSCGFGPGFWAWGLACIVPALLDLLDRYMRDDPAAIATDAPAL